MIDDSENLTRLNLELQQLNVVGIIAQVDQWTSVNRCKKVHEFIEERESFMFVIHSFINLFSKFLLIAYYIHNLWLFCERNRKYKQILINMFKHCVFFKKLPSYFRQLSQMLESIFQLCCLNKLILNIPFSGFQILFEL